MAQKLYEETNIQAIADAIREKNGATDTYLVSEMAEAIAAIETGGGGGGLDLSTLSYAKITPTKTYGAWAGFDLSSIVSDYTQIKFMVWAFPDRKGLQIYFPDSLGEWLMIYKYNSGYNTHDYQIPGYFADATGESYAGFNGDFAKSILAKLVWSGSTSMMLDTYKSNGTTIITNPFRTSWLTTVTPILVFYEEA